MEQDLYDNEQTMVVNSGAEKHISADELRKLIGLPESDNIKQFKNISNIGMGGLGAVFSAQEPGLNRRIALKTLRPEFRAIPLQIENFIREARTTAQIDHPNIVPVHRVGVMDEVGVFFTMKHIEGESLRTVLKKMRHNDKEYIRKYSLSRRLEIFISICNAISYAHYRGVIHRDLKPSNVMLGSFGEVMLMDWGIAVYRPEKDAGKERERLDVDFKVSNIKKGAKPGNISGTPAFMAPEQVLYDSDERSDIYSLGGILYTILTLAPAPFDYKLPTDELLQKVVNGELQSPRKSAKRQRIPRELEAITLKAMSLDPDDRYQTSQELLSDVRNFLDKYPVSAYRSSLSYNWLKWCIRRPIVPCTILAACLSYSGVKLTEFYQNLISKRSITSIIETNKIEGNYYFLNARREIIESDNQNDIDNAMVNFFNYSRTKQDNLRALDQISQNKNYIINELKLIAFQEYKLCHLNEDYDLLAEQYRRFNIRWREYMNILVENEPVLSHLRRLIEDKSGELTITAPTNSKLKIFSIKANRPDKLFCDTEELPTIKNLKVPAGNYLIKQYDSNGQCALSPITVYVSQNKVVKLNPLPIPPKGMVYISNSNKNAINKNKVNPFFIAKYEVTFKEYLKFWQSLSSDVLKAAYMGIWQKEDQEYANLWDKSGKLIEPFTPNMPVHGITGKAANAYCEYLSKRSKYNYRLPSILEWKIASRGSDKRTYIWGNDTIDNAALTRENAQTVGFPYGAPVGSFSLDISPYGVKDMAGNVREFVYNRENQIYQIMGGSFLSNLDLTKIGSSGNGGISQFDVGFRVAADLLKEDVVAEEEEVKVD